MAIDEIDCEIIEDTRQLKLKVPFEGKCEIVTVETDNSETDTSENDLINNTKDNTIKNINYSVEDDDVVFLASYNKSHIFLTIDDDDDDQKEEINFGHPGSISECERISIKNLASDNRVSDPSPAVDEEYEVRPPLRQYGRKPKNNVSGSNINVPLDTCNSEIEKFIKQNIDNNSLTKHNTHHTQKRDDGLKTLEELPDFIFCTAASEQVTESTNNVNISSTFIQEVQNNKETSQDSYETNEDVCDDERGEPEEQRVNLEYLLKEIFKYNSSNNEGVGPVVVKKDNKPLIISEKGVVTVIYKPEKVDLKRKISELETNSLNRCSSSFIGDGADKCTRRFKKATRCVRENRMCRSDEMVQSNQETMYRKTLNKPSTQSVSPKNLKERLIPGIKLPKKKYPPLRKVKYKGQWVYKCPDCDFTHRNRMTSLRRHMVRHQPAESIDWLYCHLCNYRAKRKGNLKTHMILHRNPAELVWYKCELCEKKFKHKNSVYSHQRRHVRPEQLDQYICDKCPYKTPFKHTLLRHKINHEPKDRKRRMMCNQCSYCTYNKYYFARHKQTHGEPLYKCLLCSYEAKFKNNLESHMKRHYPREDILYCDLCNYSANRKYTLTLHNRNVHNIYITEEDQVFFCYNCSFQTRFKRCLVKHMQIHYGERVPKIKTENMNDY